MQTVKLFQDFICRAEHTEEEGQGGILYPECKSKPASKHTGAERDLDQGETLLSASDLAIFWPLHINAPLSRQQAFSVCNLSSVQCTWGWLVAMQCMISNYDAQDKAASDSMEPAMDLMQLNGIIRKAINLVTGAQIRVDESMFELAVTSIIPGFKVNSHCYVFQNADLQTEVCSPAAALSCMLISLRCFIHSQCL